MKLRMWLVRFKFIGIINIPERFFFIDSVVLSHVRLIFYIPEGSSLPFNEPHLSSNEYIVNNFVNDETNPETFTVRLTKPPVTWQWTWRTSSSIQTTEMKANKNRQAKDKLYLP